MSNIPVLDVVILEGMWDIEVYRDTRTFKINFKLKPLPFIRFVIPMPSFAFIKFTEDCKTALNALHNEGEVIDGEAIEETG